MRRKQFKEDQIIRILAECISMGGNLLLDINSTNVILGLLIGGFLPFLFSAITMRAVGQAANKMVEEIRWMQRYVLGQEWTPWERPAEKKDEDEKKEPEIGTTLKLRDLATGEDVAIEYVTDFVFAEQAPLLAYSLLFSPSLLMAFRRAMENPPQTKARIPIMVTQVAVVISLTSR